MTGPRHQWLVRLYPRSWRERYGDEMDELLSEGSSWTDVLDIAKSAAVEWFFHCRRRGAETMRAYPGNVAVLVRKPSAIAPVIMSLMALLVVVAAIATTGAKRQPDEGAAAHIWQLLMVGQLPFLGWFVLHWLRRDIRSGLPILAVQIAAFIAALLPVWLLGL